MAQLVLSLFPGIGLLDMAFELEGFTVVRGPDVIWGGDIRTFHPPAGKFDGVIGGPPCQMFSSLARLVEANGHKTRFGNLIPEFERCVLEAQPAWFLMENVPAAPEPKVDGYGMKAFMLDNSAIAGADGWGQEQRRVRKFCFGMRGGPECSCGYCQACHDEAVAGTFEERRKRIVIPEVPSLLRWIDLATFLLPDVCNAVVDATSMNPGCTGTSKAKRERERERVGPVTAAWVAQSPGR